MGQRQAFQDLLKEKSSGAVYFVAPSADKMEYPSIVYNIDDEFALYADNNPYSRTLKYQVTVIARSPDTPLRDIVADLPMTAFSRYFVVDGLHHFVYNTFF